MVGIAAAAVLSGGAVNADNASPRARHLPGWFGSGPAVHIDSGWVRGNTENGVHQFLAIPYAAPPVDDLRWKPPQPVQKWTGVLEATELPNLCAQVTTLGVFAGPASVDEDCLFLNVYTTGLGKSSKKPVLLWIHGGGNVDGAARDYDGSKLATGGPLGTDTVVVIVNYRLGLFGFLAHPALNSEGHPFANYGIMDIQAALRWVQRNIEAFGGDPNNVAVGGQSAGAQDTAANMLSPLSAGLFHRAIQQSTPQSTMPTLETGLTRGKGFAEAAGCPGDGPSAADCLRKLTAVQILALQGRANANGPYVTGPMIDGTVIPRAPLQGWESGQFNRVPVMGGHTHDEGTFGIGITAYFANTPIPVDAEDYAKRVTASYSGPSGPGGAPPNYPAGTADKVLAQYPASAYPSPFRAYAAVTTDPGACRGLKAEQALAKWVPVYAYQFDYQNAPYNFPPMTGFEPLAAHTIDIQFLFPLWHGGILGLSEELDGPETALSNQLVGYWTRFADTGNPNGPGLQQWPRFTTGNQLILHQNVGSSTVVNVAAQRAEHKCDFWDTILVYNQ
jgi:para-nitrobenzyl esterase